MKRFEGFPDNSQLSPTAFPALFFTELVPPREPRQRRTGVRARGTSQLDAGDAAQAGHHAPDEHGAGHGEGHETPKPAAEH